MTGSVWAELWSSRWALLRGLVATLEITGPVILIGLFVGAICALVAVFGSRPLARLVDLYVYLLRGLPLLVTILFTYFGAGALWPSLPPIVVATLAMGLFAGAQMTEIFRGGIRAIPPVQLDAARAIGLTFLQRTGSVIAPLVLRPAVPSLTNVAIEMTKASTLVSALGIGDLFLSGQQVAARTLDIPETYLLMWAIYLLICLVISGLGQWIERRVSYHA